MTADRFILVLREISVSQGRLAKLLGADKGTVSRWARGVSPIPRAVALLLMLVRSGRVRVAELENYAELLG